MTKPTKKYYFVEHTDTFSGEANYCWCNRFKVLATSPKHALTKVKQEIFNSPKDVRHKVSDYGDMRRIDFSGLCECMFISEWDDECNSHYLHVKEL